MEANNFFKKVENISKQFLCSFPLFIFDWQNIFDSYINENQQEYLLNKTINSELVFKFPIQINYQKLFLKHIINKLENSIEEPSIHDEIYSTYGRLVAAGDKSNENFKHYFIDKKEFGVISLKESNSLISDGTTGLRTWQASLALSEWMIQNSNIFNQTVLELGSGIGLTGLVLEKTCQPIKIYLTDCHEAVLDNLCENVKRNMVNNLEETVSTSSLRSRCLYSHKNLSILNLPWEDFSQEVCKDLGTIEKVIAADIVYDRDLFNPLINAVKCLKDFCGVEEFIFSCTERNSETLEEFLTLMGKIFQHTEQLITPEQSHFVWPNDTPVKIYKFKD